MKDKLYYKIEETTYGSPYKFEIVGSTRNNSYTYHSIESAIFKKEEELINQLDFTIERLVEDRQKLLDFKLWKDEERSNTADE